MKLIIFILLFLCLTLSASEKNIQFTEDEINAVLSLANLPKVKADPTNKVAASEEAAVFGEMMFGDWRLSRGEEFACQTCHRTTDNWMTVRNDTDRDIPSLWNMGHHRWFFFDGRADSLWMQALGPIENPREHDFTRGEIAQLIYHDIDYKKIYEDLFGAMPDMSDRKRFPIPAKPADYDAEADKNWKSMSKEDQHKVNTVFANVGKALAAFQATITSQKTEFDVFVDGLKDDDNAKLQMLSDSEQRGLKVFIGKGRCIDCHSGPNFSDGDFHLTQVPSVKNEKYEAGRMRGIQELLQNEFNSAGKYSDDREYGRRLLKKIEAKASEKGKFKTPTLRNIVNTNPYMRDGQFKTLKDVIDYYSTLKGAADLQKGQVSEIKPRNFTEQEKKDLLAFLKSLSTFVDKEELSRN